MVMPPAVYSSEEREGRVMLEYMLVIIAVVAALVAIIVNRKSLLACVVITAVSAVLCFGFLLLYANTHRLGSYGELVSFTVTCACVLTAILIVVTFIGVKMHYKKKTSKVKKADERQLPFEVQVPATSTASVGQSDVASKYGVRPTPVGIFGRQPIEKAKPEIPSQPVVAQPTFPVRDEKPATPEVVAAPVTAAPQDAALQRMLTKGEQFVEMGQYMLAEQMFTTYMQRCDDPVGRITAELKLLSCNIAEGDKEKAMSRMNALLAGMRSGEYAFEPEQKRALAEYKMQLMKM